MQVKNVDPVCLQLGKGVTQGHVQRPLVVARVVNGGELALLVATIWRRELCRDDCDPESAHCGPPAFGIREAPVCSKAAVGVETYP